MWRNLDMKKIIAFLLMALSLFMFVSCGRGNSDDADIKENDSPTIVVTSFPTGCVLTTTYVFDDDMKLVSVEQNAEYSDTSAMVLEYSLVESSTDYFTILEKTEDSFSCAMTEEGIANFYPDATFDSILAMAEEQELTVETSK